MGALLSLFMGIWSSKKAKICIVGLSGAGKTTFLYKMCEQAGVTSKRHEYPFPPTIGSNVESLRLGRVELECWDLGGQDTLRETWSAYFAKTDGIALVIDSSDRSTIPTVRAELVKLLTNEDLAGVPLLIVMNKQDVEGALDCVEAAELLRLTDLRDRPFHLQPSVAIRNQGIREGFEWLAGFIQ